MDTKDASIEKVVTKLDDFIEYNISGREEPSRSDLAPLKKH